MPNRFSPRKSRSSGIGKAGYWVVTLIALVALLGMAYLSYAWFTDNVAQREAVAIGAVPITVPPPVEVEGLVQSAPQAVADLGNISDPSQRRAVCGYLAAELTRLNHEFKQPLPPPVIDRIATEIDQRQAQVSRYGCAPGDASRPPARRRAAQPAEDS
jgi:hypothetical protein